MSNMAIVAVYAPFAVVTAGIFVVDLLRRFKRQEHHLFTLLCFCSVCWFTSNIMGIFSNRVETAKFFVTFSLIFVGFIPPLLLLFILKFYRVPHQFSSKHMLILFIIPSINVIMTLTAKYHTLVNKQLEIISLSPSRDMIVEWGPWFWVHTAYCYIVSMVIIGMITIQHIHASKFYRIPSSMMVAGVSLTLVGNVITLLQMLPIAMDPTLITMSLSLIFFDLAIINNNNSKFVRFSRGQILHYLHEYILVLDENQRIVDYNQPAHEWFSSKKITLSSSLLMDVIKALPSEKTVQRDLEGGSDIYLNDEVFPVVLNLRIEKITDIRGEQIGTIAVFTDVTQNRMLIERLEEKAGMDSLTGLANHMAYVRAKKQLDNQEYFPLSIIMCDANGLKYINDNYGHLYGDLTLKVIAEVLDEVCPKQCFVARIGGDEFIYLLPYTLPETVYALMEKINETLANCNKTPFAISLALGTATKFSVEEDLDEIIAFADSRMYDNKRYMKKQMVQKQ